MQANAYLKQAKTNFQTHFESTKDDKLMWGDKNCNSELIC